MTRRAGLSLMEVLTALFILALGTIAILTMFPLGALQMAQAVRDDRSATAAFAADNYFRTYWKHNIVDPTKNGAGEEFYKSLTAPNTIINNVNALTTTSVLPPNNKSFSPVLNGQVSYPVFVDPMGCVAPRPSAMSRYWIGDGGETYIPRRTLVEVAKQGVAQNTYAQRLCSLMDGLGYDDDGKPNGERELRYNFLWVVQCPAADVTNNIPNIRTANLTVVVFDRRAHLFAPPGSELVYQAPNIQPGTSSVTFTGLPDIKPGAWIMDATVSTTPLLRHANFYLVTAVNGNTVELQSPIKNRSDGSTVAYPGMFVVLRGVSGVFERPPLTGE